MIEPSDARRRCSGVSAWPSSVQPSQGPGVKELDALQRYGTHLTRHCGSEEYLPTIDCDNVLPIAFALEVLLMTNFIPVWILGAPFVGLLILSFTFKGPSAMGGEFPRALVRERSAIDPSAPLLDPLHPDAVRRNP